MNIRIATANDIPSIISMKLAMFHEAIHEKKERGIDHAKQPRRIASGRLQPRHRVAGFTGIRIVSSPWVGHSLSCGFVMMTHDNNNEWPTLSLTKALD